MAISVMAAPETSGTARAKQRKNYARIPDIVPIPDLKKAQRQSYDWFCSEGLIELFDEISPIESFNKNLRLYFPGSDQTFNDEWGLAFRFDEPPYSEDECRERDSTYARPLYVTVLLENAETGQQQVQEVYMGDFPVMTDNATFIINGAERVVVSQLIRSPGAYYTAQEDRTTGRRLCMAKLIPNRGAWLEFETSKRDVISVKVDRKRKIPVTVLLKALGAVPDQMLDPLLDDVSNEALLALFVDVDRDADHPFIATTLQHDPNTTAEDALIDFYKRMRPGDPATLENATSYLDQLLFSPRRYDLGRVGRYKLNRRIGRPDDFAIRTLTKRDVLELVKRIIRIDNGLAEPDDIDHLGNRRIKTMGELLQNQLRVGFLRTERVVRERMSTHDQEQVSPVSLINIRPVVAVVREFFGGSQLSQFMSQHNPLDELTHKRTLSALGPGGLRRERAGFDVRDVHYSHYGRICPVETPEGPNIGLIVRLATFAEINDYGFIETPYRVVAHEAPNDKDFLVGRTIRESVSDANGETIIQSGDVITEAAAEALAALDRESFRVHPYATDRVLYLSADEEENSVVAQANSELDELDQFIGDRVSARYYDKFVIENVDRVMHMDVSPKQVFGVSAALIPFLDHDDANRALMGSNMQRQAVPLLNANSPVVGTGMEARAAVDSGQVVLALEDGRVKHASGEEIVVEGESGERVYKLRRFARSNQSTCVDQTPLVNRGDIVRKGDALADAMATEDGELALGQNVLCAFMSWEGGNYEDAIVVSEDCVRKDMFTSIHIEKHEVEARDTKLGPEEITRDIPNVGEDALRNLDEDGIIYVGASVSPGDILVGKITPKGETELTPEEKLLRAIFGEKAREVKDSSLKLPHGEEGKVVEVNVFTRDDNQDLAAGVEKMVRVAVAQRRKIVQGDKIAGRHGNKGVISGIVPIEDMPYLSDGTPVQIILNPLGVPGRMNVGQILETHLGWAAERLGFKVMTPVSDGASEDEIASELARAWLMDRAWADLHVRAWDWVVEDEIDTTLMRDDSEVVLNYLGGLLGAEGMSFSEIDSLFGDEVRVRRFWLSRWLAEKGYNPADALMYEDEKASIAHREAVDTYATEICLRVWLQDEGVDVEGLSRDQTSQQALTKAKEMGAALPTSGKMVLYDGKTGQTFDRPVTVGIIYMLKLNHLVQDKIHARSTGPYSLVTQQPLGGKAQFGGQRFGEMEVWALEAYGAAHTLQEMLTIKSDDVVGRVKTYEAIVKGEPIEDAGVPESFSVLIKELQGLGLAVHVYDDDGAEVSLKHDDTAATMPNLGLGLGFGASMR